MLFFCPSQVRVFRVLRPVCCVRVRRSVLHERQAEAQPAAAVSAVVAQPGHLQVSRCREAKFNLRVID